MTAGLFDELLESVREGGSLLRAERTGGRLTLRQLRPALLPLRQLRLALLTAMLLTLAGSSRVDAQLNMRNTAVLMGARDTTSMMLLGFCTRGPGLSGCGDAVINPSLSRLEPYTLVVDRNERVSVRVFPQADSVRVTPAHCLR
jgi:hypothetical protein